MTRSLHNYIDYVKALSPDSLAEEMEVLNNLLPAPYFVLSGPELAELERNAADFGEWKYREYLPNETFDDGKQTYYVCLESPGIYAGEVYVTVHCKPDPANPDKPARLAAREEGIEWERVDNFEIKTSADFKNYDDSIYWRLAEALECEEDEEYDPDTDDVFDIVVEWHPDYCRPGYADQDGDVECAPDDFEQRPNRMEFSLKRADLFRYGEDGIPRRIRQEVEGAGISWKLVLYHYIPTKKEEGESDE